MSQWNDEKNKVKDIFDCIRNFALCGVVLYVGIINFSKKENAAFMFYINTGTGIFLTLLALYLFYINMKSFTNIVKREHKAGNVGRFFSDWVPPVIFMLGVSLFSQSVLSIKTESGKSLGELSIKDTLKNEKESKEPNK